MSSKKPEIFVFDTKLQKLEGTVHTVIYLPADIIQSLPAGRIRTKGTINAVTPFALAVQNQKDGSRYLMVGTPLRRTAKIREGSAVHVEFVLADPSVVELPEELEAVLEQDDEGRKIFFSFTTGYQRSLAYYVGSVKNTDSRIKRAFEIIEKAKTRQLDAQKKEDRK